MSLLIGIKPESMDIEAASPSGRVESSYTKSTQAIRSNDNSLEGQKQRILSKRGAFSCLPVYYENGTKILC